KAKTWEVEVSSSTGTEEGEARVIVQLRDITKTERLQESLRRSETMAVLGAVVGGVAHEVRNPLFGMSSVLDAFEARFGDRVEFRPYLPLLRTELGRMTDLMQALLDYGKPQRFEMAACPVAEQVGAALELCRPLAERRQVRLEVDLDAVGPIFCDPHRMTQVLKNLIENAVQHSPAGSRVQVTARPLQVDGQGWVRLTVRDQGPGFPAADLTRVLEPFFSRRKGGTGLGLSIVSRTVEGHGGSLRLDNDADGGARVEIDLPGADPYPGGE
ncbi:MAG TPA: HAMP domain-containing sensor histidine kinase, partial [Thermoanaerobaculia bacterium]|nr:HAMP domain-containing sensor histidine kinase [Thermoanaerobaculia bacterium]